MRRLNNSLVVVVVGLACGVGACEVQMGVPGAHTADEASSGTSSGHDAKALEDKYVRRWREDFPKTVDNLLRAEHLIASGKAVDALAALDAADSIYRTEKVAQGEDPGPNNPSDVLQGWSDAMRATATWMTGDRLETLGVASPREFIPEACHSAISAKCSEVADDLQKIFPGIWGYSDPGIVVDSQVIVDKTVSTLVMAGLDDRLKKFRKNGWPRYTAFVYPERVSRGRGGALRLSWYGRSESWLSSACKRVGSVDFGDSTFDVSSCRDVEEHSTPAAVSLEVPAQDAALVRHRKKGDIVGILLDVDQEKKTGRNRWSLGKGRAFFAGKIVKQL